jgi:FixJ family two-component response regulator
LARVFDVPAKRDAAIVASQTLSVTCVRVRRGLMAETLFIVDPLPDERSRIMTALADESVAIEIYESGAQFLDQVAKNASGCVVAPIDLPGMGLRALIGEINRRHLPLAVVVIGRDSELDSAVELVRAGAFDFLEHPFSDRRLRSVVRRAIGAPA